MAVRFCLFLKMQPVKDDTCSPRILTTAKLQGKSALRFGHVFGKAQRAIGYFERDLGLRDVVTCRWMGNSPFIRHISVYKPNWNWHTSLVATLHNFIYCRYVVLNAMNVFGAMPKGVTSCGSPARLDFPLLLSLLHFTFNCYSSLTLYYVEVQNRRRKTSETVVSVYVLPINKQCI